MKGIATQDYIGKHGKRKVSIPEVNWYELPFDPPAKPWLHVSSGAARLTYQFQPRKIIMIAKHSLDK